jgi:16S rRNA processing protein RimM
MDAQAFGPLGRVAKTHGLNGEVSVIMTVDLPVERLPGIEVWFVPPPAAFRTARITAVRPGPKGPLFAFDVVGDLTAAEALRGATILARRCDMPEPEEEFDPVGLEIIDEERGSIGTVTDVIVTGANDVWVLDGPLGEILIPVIDDVILDVDVDSGLVRVALLPGLIEGS